MERLPSQDDRVGKAALSCDHEVAFDSRTASILAAQHSRNKEQKRETEEELHGLIEEVFFRKKRAPDYFQKTRKNRNDRKIFCRGTFRLWERLSILNFSRGERCKENE